MFSLIFSFGIWPLISYQLQSHYHAQTAIPEWSAITQNKQWQEVNAPGWNWQPKFKGAVTESLRYFKKQETIIGLYQANFGNEKQGSELINMQNVLINGGERKNWHFIKQSSLSLKSSENKHGITVDSARLRGKDTDIITAKWYQVGSQNTNNKYLAKIYQLYKRLILDTRPEIYYVVFSRQPQTADLKNANPVLAEFIRNLFSMQNSG